MVPRFFRSAAVIRAATGLVLRVTVRSVAVSAFTTRAAAPVGSTSVPFLASTIAPFAP